MNPAFSFRITAIVVAVFFGLTVPTYAQKGGKSRQPKWDALNFGSQLDNGDTYSIKKLVLDVPINEKQVCFGPVKGIFENNETSFDKLEINDRQILARLESSFGSFFRLRQRGVTSYGQLGKITVLTNNGQFEITISELGFNLGDGYPSQKNTFYSWTLAKILNDEARKLGGDGLKSEHFNVLSGIHWIESAKSSYEKLKPHAGKLP
jgi:hypothetical protein